MGFEIMIVKDLEEQMAWLMRKVGDEDNNKDGRRPL